MPSSPESAKDRLAVLVQAYRALSEADRLVMKFISIWWNPITVPAVNEAMTRSAPWKAEGPFDKNAIPMTMTRLLRARLIKEAAGGYVISPGLGDLLSRASAVEDDLAWIVPLIPRKKSSSYSYVGFHNAGEAIRDARIALLEGADDEALALDEMLLNDYGYSDETRYMSLMTLAFFPFDPQWVAQVPPRLRLRLALRAADAMREQPSALELLLPVLRKDVHLLTRKEADLSYPTFSLLLQAGEFELIQEFASFAGEPYTGLAVGIMAIKEGDHARAAVAFEAATKDMRKGKDRPANNGLLGLFTFLQAYCAAASGLLGKMKIQIPKGTTRYHHWGAIAEQIQALCDSYQGKTPPIGYSEIKNSEWKANNTNPLGICIRALCYPVVWKRSLDSIATGLVATAERCEGTGRNWLAHELYALAAKGGHGRAKAELARLAERLGVAMPLCDATRDRPAWEAALEQIEEVLGKPTRRRAREVPDSGDNVRLAWGISVHREQCIIEAIEQKRNAKGEWSSGKVTGLKKLRNESAALPYLTDQDRKALTAVVEESSYSLRLAIDPAKCLPHLVGHPLLLDAEARTPITLEAKPVAVVAIENADGSVKLRLEPSTEHDWLTYLIQVPEPGHLVFYELTPQIRALAKSLNVAASFPAKAKERLGPVLERLTTIAPVHTDLGEDTAHIPATPGDPTPVFQMVPAGSGFRASLAVRPFGPGGPSYRPGLGPKTPAARLPEGISRVARDMEAEVNAAEMVVDALPTLAEAEDPAAPWQWEFSEPESALELLEFAHGNPEKLRLEWAEGKKLSVVGKASSVSMRTSVMTMQDWFSISGQIVVNDERRFELSDILNRTAGAKGRFVEVGEGQFLAITADLRKRLEELRSLGEQHGKDLRVHQLAAPLLEATLADAGEMKTDKEWKETLRRFDEAQRLEPQVPGTLRAELRDYQVEGFQWMVRLAHSGMGALLADDMGLGKTVQAIALLLDRAAKGPALVVAPTSVCPNWVSELQRFSPTLRPVMFGEGPRKDAIEAAGPFDVMIVSYGLMQNEAEHFAAHKWTTAILDEAQAIKNTATKRSQAAMTINADFRLVLTGTPIENHLGELWNLFRFINPGLLGSQERFTKKFATRIERMKDRAAQQTLKRLVSPFLLRRTKDAVLDELPSRTEITHLVELSKEEQEFYEVIRRHALEKLAEGTSAAGDRDSGARHLRILAEIMKLRRACCNARLVTPEVTMPSAKMEEFIRIVEELLEGRHKALVFSQFVDHLTLIRKVLDAKKIKYQYLDGSTPMGERKKRVDAFQAGEGDLFLISLKAGGTGLNLTAADYVIHMDPWWNPAVEDQASDRAHRLGQLRPVTIYRIVAKNTIEEKIVALHHMKRDLADGLLAGSDAGSKMSANELMMLLRQ